LSTGKAFARVAVENSAAPSLNEIPEFLERLSMARELNSARACRMLALTRVRTGELRKMEWEEIDGDTWIIPEGEMKRRQEHV
jgi:integrase